MNVTTHRILRAPVSFGAIVFTTCLVVLLASVAQATPLNPSSTIGSSPEPDPTGGLILLANSGPIPFVSDNGSFSGTLTSEVFKNDASNLNGPNALTFTYLISSNATSTSSMDRLTVNGFAGFLTDASYQVPGPAGVPPSFFNRSAAGIDGGDVVGALFLSGGGPFLGVIGPGQNSALLVVQTDSLQFNNNTAAVIDGSTASGIATYAPRPSNLVPEPSTLVLGAIGLLGVAALRRRKLTA